VIRSRIESRLRRAEKVATLWKFTVFSTPRATSVALDEPAYDAAHMSLADPSDLRSIAHLIDHHAQKVRDTAARLCGAAEGSHWHGPAADAFRVHARAVARLHHSAADQLEHAASALVRHADIVETELAVAHAAAGLLSAAVHAVGL
jgi:hypothetical protein